MPSLFEPLVAGDLHLRNRVVMAPLTRCRAGAGRVPTDLNLAHYVQRAGAGMILTEATAVTPMGVGYPDTPGLWSDEQVAGWRKITQAVHAKDGLIVAQLWHVGRISDPVYLDGALPVAPSAVTPAGHVNLVRPKKEFVTPRALDIGEIPGIVEAYRRAAENAVAAGFDGVELHAANGYLIDQFLQDKTNRRSDAYGGSVENRARLLLEIADAVIAVWGAGRVGVHLAPRGDSNDAGDSNPRAIFSHVAAELAKRQVAFLFLRERPGEDSLLPEIKRIFGGVVIANEGLTRASAETLLAEGAADAASWGKAFIANPDLVDRLAKNAPLNDLDPTTLFGADFGPKGYTDYPALADVDA